MSFRRCCVYLLIIYSIWVYSVSACVTNNGITYCLVEGCGSVGPKWENNPFRQTGVLLQACEGYVISDLLIDGISVGAVSEYLYPPGFTDSEHRIDAFFKLKDSESYYWYTSPWSLCSNTCGEGVQTRTVQCRDSNGSIVSESNCSSAKPDTSQICSDYSGGIRGDFDGNGKLGLEDVIGILQNITN